MISYLLITENILKINSYQSSSKSYLNKNAKNNRFKMVLVIHKIRLVFVNNFLDTLATSNLEFLESTTKYAC